MKDENVTDVREWLQYYQYVLLPPVPVNFFSKFKKKPMFRYFYFKYTFCIIEIHDFQGELTDMLAKTDTLVLAGDFVVADVSVRSP